MAASEVNNQATEPLVKQINGIDVWVEGEPTQAYAVLQKTETKAPHRLFGGTSYLDRMAAQAVAIKGDAVIVGDTFSRYSSQKTKTMTWHTLPSGAGYPTYSSYRSGRRVTSYTVIKYK